MLTHELREPLVKEGGMTFTFVTDGIEPALERARGAAGDKDVSVAGGAHVIHQYLKAALLDEIQIHVVAVLVGNGVRLFDRLGTEQIELKPTRDVDGRGVTHIRFDVVR
jgi:dihydrofolate reductase